MTATIKRNRTSMAAISRTRVPKKRTAPKRTDELDITPERREQIIAELRLSIEKSLEKDRIEEAKNADLWEMPKEKITVKDRRRVIAVISASVKRGIGLGKIYLAYWKMIVIADSNIIISALISPKGRAARVLKEKSNIPFMVPDRLLTEVYQHWGKIIELTTLSKRELFEEFYFCRSRITFVKDIDVPQKHKDLFRTGL